MEEIGNLDPDGLMAMSDRFKAILDMATGQREEALARGYSPTAAEQLALQSYAMAMASRSITIDLSGEIKQNHAKFASRLWKFYASATGLFAAIAITSFLAGWDLASVGIYLSIAVAWGVMTYAHYHDARSYSEPDSEIHGDSPK